MHGWYVVVNVSVATEPIKSRQLLSAIWRSIIIVTWTAGKVFQNLYLPRSETEFTLSSRNPTVGQLGCGGLVHTEDLI